MKTTYGEKVGTSSVSLTREAQVIVWGGLKEQKMKRFKRTEQNDILITDYNPSKYKIGFFGANTQFSFSRNINSGKCIAMLWHGKRQRNSL